MELLTKKCPDCGKKINSLYPTQLDQNYNAHVSVCKKKKKKRDKNVQPPVLRA